MSCKLECELRYTASQIRNKYGYDCQPWHFPSSSSNIVVCDPWESYDFFQILNVVPNSNCSDCLPGKPLGVLKLISGQSYKHLMLVIYKSRVAICGIFMSGTTLES